jgi:hypothetical protein
LGSVTLRSVSGEKSALMDYAQKKPKSERA